ncbi:four helix bundle protein [Lutibacter sp.]|uniref:four helix bundle protein n=1 Tax=Lutibacter sp. TaxID=1925666 RepID=UPI0025C44BBA|nr:four helix bundle protein [Lutibacter sp.]MCF6182114.1 four helix bundle protein [Lutibacter sp.]
MRNFREYDVWIDAMELVNKIYDSIDNFPKDERFGLISQITRSAVSIPSNIAEGASRSSEKDFGRFLEISLGSAYELETQLRIARNRNYLKNDNFTQTIEEIISLQKRISAFRNSIKKN